MAVNVVAAGGRLFVSWPKLLLPQQASVPVVLIPQVWKLPELIAVKVPTGGVPMIALPQQLSVWSVLMPQVW